MKKDQRGREEDESSSSVSSFEAPDDLILECHASFNDSDITFDRTDRLEQDGSSGSEENNNKDAYADYRRQTERIRTREQYNSPLRNRVAVQAPANMPLFSRPIAAVHQKMNSTINHFRKEKDHQSSDYNLAEEGTRNPAMRSVRRNHSSESKTPTGSMDLNDFQLLASGGIPDSDRGIRRNIRRSQSADREGFEHAQNSGRDIRRSVRRSKSTDGAPFEHTPDTVRDSRRGARRNQSLDGIVDGQRRDELRDLRRHPDRDEMLDFQALAAGGGRTRRDLRRHKINDQF